MGRLFWRIDPLLASSQAFAWFAPEINRMNWLGLAATVVLFGTWGDLIESLLKRTLGVKTLAMYYQATEEC